MADSEERKPGIDSGTGTAPAAEATGTPADESGADAAPATEATGAPADESGADAVSAGGAAAVTADAAAGSTAAARAGKRAVEFIKSVLGIGQPGDRVPGGEKISYYAYFAGQNLIYALVATYLTTFALLQGMDAEKVALVLVLVKVWDAFNDAIFGALFDKVKFRSGNKFMPWLRMSVVAIPLSVILLFAIPAGISEAGQLAWLAIAYLIHDCVYTLCDAPIYGCVTVLTDNFGEREKKIGRAHV